MAFIRDLDNIIPVMTSNSMSGYVASASGEWSGPYQAWKAFNGGSGEWVSTNVVSWLKIQLPYSRIVNKYNLVGGQAGYLTNAPSAWTFEGSNDNNNWTILDTRTSINNWADTTAKTFVFSNNVAYSFYKINITADNGNGVQSAIIELELCCTGQYSSLIPVMTSNTLPSGVASASTEYAVESHKAYNAFIGTTQLFNYSWVTATVATGWLAYEFPVAKVVKQYSFFGRDTYAIDTPKNWTFEGYDGTSWIVLDTQVNVTDWLDKTCKTYSINNSTAYTKYRINVTLNNGGPYVAICRLRMFGYGLPVNRWKLTSDANDYGVGGDTIIDTTSGAIRAGNMLTTEASGLRNCFTKDGIITKIVFKQESGGAGSASVDIGIVNSDNTQILSTYNGCTGTADGTWITLTGLNIPVQANQGFIFNPNDKSITCRSGNGFYNTGVTTLSGGQSVITHSLTFWGVITYTAKTNLNNNGGVTFDANNGASFNGTNQWLSGSKTNNNIYTMSCWVKENNVSTYQGFMFFTTGNMQGLMGVSGDTSTRFYSGNSSNTLQVSGDYVAANFPSTSFVLLTGTYDGTTVKLYRNGNLIGSAIITSYPESNFVLGSRAGNFFLNGYLLDARIYDYDLSTSEINALYAYGPNGAVSDGLDDNFTKSLLHFDGNLTDQSGKTWTASGGASTSTVQSKFGNGSMLFSNSSANSSLVFPAHSDFTFGTGDFSVDFWIHLTSIPSIAYPFVIAQSGTTHPAAIRYMSGNLAIAVAGTYSSDYAWTPTLNKWYHFALIRSGSSVKFFIDGISVITMINSGDCAQYQCNVGGINWGGVGYAISGYIDELRISKGVVRWINNFSPPVEPYSSSNKATGGTITSDGTYMIHTFYSSGTFTANQTLTSDALIIAGGGGGGGMYGGGGGAGGVIQQLNGYLTPQTYTVVVGSGGAGGIASGSVGIQGGNSSFNGQIAIGGGGGGWRANASVKGPPTTGGSGGGAGDDYSTFAGIGASGTSGQGYSGGNSTSSKYSGAGGGGAGGNGFNPPVGNNNGGNGGIGITSSISGVSMQYAGGGGGSTWGGSGAAGGIGTYGGGNGGYGMNSTVSNSTTGYPNTGGGGGGGGDYGTNMAGAYGGSGVVIIRYLINQSNQPTFSATGGTITQVNGKTIHTFTSNGTFIPNGVGTVETLVVAGGGGGGKTNFVSGLGGGGGAGGVKITTTTVNAQSYNITVGAGGAAATSSTAGSDGQDSSFNGIISTGGGGGGGGTGDPVNGRVGGSGGGSANWTSTYGAGIVGQGYAGGSGVTSVSSGGGGGAGSPAVNAVGGSGVLINITGTPTYYGGGGGGGNYALPAPLGGTGGGGAGTSYYDISGVNGTPNTGGGGGAGPNPATGRSGGNGGSGIVIISYTTSQTPTFVYLPQPIVFF